MVLSEVEVEVFSGAPTCSHSSRLRLRAYPSSVLPARKCSGGAASPVALVRCSASASEASLSAESACDFCRLLFQQLEKATSDWMRPAVSEPLESRQRAVREPLP